MFTGGTIWILTHSQIQENPLPRPRPETEGGAEGSEVAQLEAQSSVHAEVDALRGRLREAEAELGKKLGDLRPGGGGGGGRRGEIKGGPAFLRFVFVLFWVFVHNKATSSQIKSRPGDQKGVWDRPTTRFRGLLVEACKICTQARQPSKSTPRAVGT